MGHKYRTREKIIYELLTNIETKQGVIGSTELMYKVFLSHYQLKDYLRYLEDVSMIRRDPEQSSRLYITNKGRKLLKLLEQINVLIGRNANDPLLRSVIPE